MARKILKKRLGTILVEMGLIDGAQLAEALEEQKRRGGKLGSLLVQSGMVGEEDLLVCLSMQLRLPRVDFLQTAPSAIALKLVPYELARKHTIVPVSVEHELGKRILVTAMSDPTDLEAIREIEFRLALTVKPVVATESTILRTIEQCYRGRHDRESFPYRLHGWAAIEYADRYGVSLHAYGPGLADSTTTIELEQARTVVEKNPQQVYLDVCLCESCLTRGEFQEAEGWADPEGLWMCGDCFKGRRGAASAQSNPQPQPA